MNRLNVLPRGFGAFPALEVLDATYNNLSERSFPANFFMLGNDSGFHCLGIYIIIFICITLTETLRALYLADNDFEYLPAEIGQLKNLQVVSIALDVVGKSFTKLLFSWFFATMT